MNGINFRGIYEIPLSKSQGPTTKSFNMLMDESTPIVEKSEEQYYNPDKQIFYLPIQDKNEKLFEQLAKVYYINVNKSEKDATSGSIKLMKADSPSQKINEFVISAITMGAKHDISNNEGNKEITFYEDDGKTVYAIFKYSNGQLTEKHTYLDGKPAHITTFNEDGSFKYTRFPYSDDFGKVRASGDIIINEKRLNNKDGAQANNP